MQLIVDNFSQLKLIANYQLSTINSDEEVSHGH